MTDQERVMDETTAGGGATAMRRFYWAVGLAVAGTILAVLFVPGLDEWVQRTVLQYVSGAAR